MNTICINPDILSKTVGDEEVLVDLKTGTYFGLNPSGTVIWNGLKEGKNPTEILQDLSETFTSETSEFANDYNYFIKQLQEKNFITKI